MVLSFDIIRENKRKLELLIKDYPQVIDHFDGKLDWSYMVNSKLAYIADPYYIFNKEKNNLDMLLGNTTISFEELKEKMVISAKKNYKDGKKSDKEDCQDSRDEVDELKRVKKVIKTITESEFISMFENNSTDKLFPYLYRLEINLSWSLESEIMNYLTSMNVNIHDDFDSFDIGHYIKEVTIDKKEMNEKLQKFLKAEKVKDEILELLKSDSFGSNLEFIKREISRYHE